MHFRVIIPILATKLPAPSLSEVEDFLRRLRVSMGATTPFILFEDRPDGKNKQGLVDLKLKSFFDCIPYITALTSDHASHVLQTDNAQEAAAGRHLWVFGVLVGKKHKTQRPAYVKIQLGHALSSAVCISFHWPDFPLSFLFPSDHSTQFKLAYDAQSQNR